MKFAPQGEQKRERRDLPPAHKKVDLALQELAAMMDIVNHSHPVLRAVTMGFTIHHVRDMLFQILDEHAHAVRAEILADARTPETPQ